MLCILTRLITEYSIRGYLQVDECTYRVVYVTEDITRHTDIEYGKFTRITTQDNQ
jgi:hypothetical protein